MEKQLIISHIYKKVKIHLLYYIVAIIVIVTGHFNEFLIFTILILIHEIGHILVALYYNWEIEKITIMPFGGLITFNSNLNKPIKEELLILIAGPLLQQIFYILATIIYPNPTLTNYNFAILFFNLIPIIPLDGSKLINLLLNKFIPFKKSNKITINISILILITALIYLKLDLLLSLIIIFLIIKTIKQWKKQKYIFNKFLLERYLYKIKFKKIKLIKGLNLKKTYRDHYHLFKNKNKIYQEKEELKKMFDKT